MRFDDAIEPDQIEVTKALLINHDPPEHTRLRRLVSKAFTPRAVKSLEAKLDAAARRIVSEAAAKGTGDFVDDIAVDLPLLAIADLLGVPEEDRRKLFHWSTACSTPTIRNSPMSTRRWPRPRSSATATTWPKPAQDPDRRHRQHPGQRRP